MLIWSGSGGGGGARLAEAAHALGFADKAGCAVFHLPAPPNARGVAEAWAAAADEDEVELEGIGLLVVSGDEAASDPGVRALAERADAVIAITMFHSPAVGWAEPRPSRHRGARARGDVDEPRGSRAAPPPRGRRRRCRTSSPGSRSSPSGSTSTLSPHPPSSSRSSRGGSTAASSSSSSASTLPLPARASYVAPAAAAEGQPLRDSPRRRRALRGDAPPLRYRPLFSGHQVERVPELQFQRPEREVGLSLADADRRGIATGDVVDVRSNGTSVELRARVDRTLVEGVARVAEEHAADLHLDVEVVKA